MLFVDFGLASIAVLIYSGLKWLLMGLLVAASRIWNHARYAVPLVLGLLLVGVGAMIKLLHWGFDKELLLSGAALFAASYCLWFRAKKRYAILDFLKLGWVLSATATIVALAVFRLFIKSAVGITEAFFWAVALLYVYQRWIRRPEHSAE